MKRKKKKAKDMKHCDLHDQDFMSFLKECPICVGERLGEMFKLGLPYTIPRTAIRRKHGKKR